jgi:hypothetical protein
MGVSTVTDGCGNWRMELERGGKDCCEGAGEVGEPFETVLLY